jgi:hypothetical protein
MIKAISVDLLASFFFSEVSASSVSPRKIGTFAMGFIIAKNPVNTVKANVNNSFISIN